MPICSDTGGGIGETLHDNILKPAATSTCQFLYTQKLINVPPTWVCLQTAARIKSSSVHVMTLPLAFLAASMIALCQGQSHDLTLEAGARGTEVVEAVVEKIRSSCVFPEDRQFLRRVAHVVSNDGTDTDTYGPHFHGGIWKVTEAMFNATQDCYNEDIRLACSNISASFNIEWPSVAWSELRKPLYSGLALALATLLNVGNDTLMPGSVTGQGDLWARMYGGNRSEFASDANLEANFECNVKMDLAFILDSSNSISKNDFGVMRKFAADVIDAMDISADHVLVAGIVYGSTTKIQFDFNDYTTKAEALELMKNTTKEGGGTWTNLALIQAANVLYRTDARDDAKKVAILITDGQSDNVNLTRDAGKRLKDLGTSVFAIGVGRYDRDELNRVASYPTCSYVLTVTSFTHIQSILTGIQKSVCETRKTCDGNTTSTSTRQLCETTLPDKPVIECEVNCGFLDVYVSVTNTKPGPVVYDYKYQVKPGTPTVLTVTKRLAAGTKVYTNVVGTPFTGAAATNCSYSWSLNVTRQKDVKVICKENGVKRTCTNRDVDKAGLCSRDEFPFENPCTRENLKRGLMRHPHPFDSTKFLLCDLAGKMYVASCPGDDIFNKDTSKCGFTSPGSPAREENGNYSLANDNGNPCSPEAIAKGQFYFTYSPDETKFIQCNEWGESWVKPCASGTVWSQDAYTCIRKGDNVQVVPRTVVSLPEGDNPCTPETRAKGQFYFPYSSDETKFIQCNEWGKYWVMPCAPGTVWSQDAYTCIRKGEVSGSGSVVEVFCKENGVRRDCTKRDVAEAALCAKDKITFKNPCSRKNLKRRLLRHPYPFDSTKFLLCDLTGTVYLVCCPGDVTFNNRTRQCGSKPSGPPPPTGPSNPGNTGPCTPQAIARGQFYFPYNPDETKFIQCNEWGKYWVMPCAPGTVWSQKAYTCIRKGYNPGPNPGSPVTSPPQWTSSASWLYNTTTASVPGSLGDNPCTPAARTKCRFYFTYSPDETKFIQCNEWGESWVRPCAPGTVWSQNACTCIRKGDNPGPNSEPTVTSPPASTTPVYQPTTTSSPNPCTDEALANEQFYFPHESDETKYIQCDKQGGAVEKQCQPGSLWSQDHFSCIKKGAE
ncbi:uncharacterized protein [Littorina saxatilis]|uniref:Uncharacterized protein n=1 Tax=Littorina saxatilis TaxID=31220 RepID=A0AAN9AYU0_9CAEN